MSSWLFEDPREINLTISYSVTIQKPLHHLALLQIINVSITNMKLFYLSLSYLVSHWSSKFCSPISKFWNRKKNIWSHSSMSINKCWVSIVENLIWQKYKYKDLLRISYHHKKSRTPNWVSYKFQNKRNSCQRMFGCNSNLVNLLFRLGYFLTLKLIKQNTTGSINCTIWMKKMKKNLFVLCLHLEIFLNMELKMLHFTSIWSQ